MRNKKNKDINQYDFYDENVDDADIELIKQKNDTTNIKLQFDDDVTNIEFSRDDLNELIRMIDEEEKR